ncbi:MAG: response regulator [Desulfobulbaceae bacterium]|nr:response regulator [Desulfobulbaceae bacterium]
MDLHSENILFVDDDESLRGLVRSILTREGYSCKTATCVKEALNILKMEKFSLLISDIKMPGKSGMDLLDEVNETYKDMAVIMATGVNDRTVAVRSLHMGAFGYVTKPFDRNELIINVINALRRRKLEIESRMHNEELEALVFSRTEELRFSREETIHKLARAGEFRDNETAHHTVRMGHYCEILAQSAGQSHEFCQKLKIAAQLHDVGKIGISDTILLKPGRLTKSEFEEIKKHAEIGYRILGGSRSEVLNLGAVVALTHHEKFNGSGYPEGIQGDAIPLAGRICAVCDVFDALTSKRVYKDAMAVEEALGILKKEKNEHFDPELVDLFLKEIEKILGVKAKFVDASNIFGKGPDNFLNRNDLHEKRNSSCC